MAKKIKHLYGKHQCKRWCGREIASLQNSNNGSALQQLRPQRKHTDDYTWSSTGIHATTGLLRNDYGTAGSCSDHNYSGSSTATAATNGAHTTTTRLAGQLLLLAATATTTDAAGYTFVQATTESTGSILPRQCHPGDYWVWLLLQQHLQRAGVNNSFYDSRNRVDWVSNGFCGSRNNNGRSTAVSTTAATATSEGSSTTEGSTTKATGEATEPQHSNTCQKQQQRLLHQTYQTLRTT